MLKALPLAEEYCRKTIRHMAGEHDVTLPHSGWGEHESEDRGHCQAIWEVTPEKQSCYAGVILGLCDPEL